MKKVILSLILTLALALVAAMPASAAETLPVFVEGQKIAEPALVKNGVSYLPMRSIYEALGAKVDWDAKNKRVIATEPSGIWTEIPLNGDCLVVHYSAHSDTTASLEERRPFARGGKIYLPVRLVSDTMGYDVDYNKQRIAVSAPRLTYNSADGVYTLNLLSGELTLSQAGGAKRLGVVEMLSTRGFGAVELSGFSVEATPGGNYLLRSGGILSGALTNSLQMYAWLPGDGDKAVTVYSASVLDPLPAPCWAENVLWLSGSGVVFAVDEKNDTVTEYDIADIYGEECNYMCYWTDGRFMLLGDGADFDVYDIKTKELIDLKTAVLEPDIKAQVQTFMQQNSWGANTPEKFAALWEGLGNTFAALGVGDEVVYLNFVKEADGVLYFDLILHYWAVDAEGKPASISGDKTFNITYALPY